ncbi:matrix protein M [Almpiwar virus]|uniref:Matrix protein M n=1 Tax=Almpiwar virus TaxID=318843 RepID=A0A024A140_9RHAB|nr:matrix protein M [Almpiwar virus]AHY85664.1 matrix protein M [Almpiwar virus]
MSGLMNKLLSKGAKRSKESTLFTNDSPPPYNPSIPGPSAPLMESCIYKVSCEIQLVLDQALEDKYVLKDILKYFLRDYSGISGHKLLHWFLWGLGGCMLTKGVKLEGGGWSYHSMLSGTLEFDFVGPIRPSDNYGRCWYAGPINLGWTTGRIQGETSFRLTPDRDAENVKELLKKTQRNCVPVCFLLEGSPITCSHGNKRVQIKKIQ